MSTTELKTTPLHALHAEHGAKFVPFAGYDMPVQYETGVKDEHLWTRSQAGLFDVSHMGPCFLELVDGLGTDGAHQEIARIVERVVPGDIQNLKPGQARLTVLLNDQGGILDDLIITRPAAEEDAGRLYIVVNGAVKDQDFEILGSLTPKAKLIPADDGVLFALQGPQAANVMASFVPGTESLTFMRSNTFNWNGESLIVSRCGYTGEDGFEILASAQIGRDLVEKLVNDDRVKPIGLGARDSLRLEAGLCLYGHDIDRTTTPIEADLTWLVSKKRREDASFPGAAIILEQIALGPKRKRVGIQPLGRAPAREGVTIQLEGEAIGQVTSGGFGPSVNKPIAMGYVAADHAVAGTKLDLVIRGKLHPAEVCDLPFVTPNYKR